MYTETKLIPKTKKYTTLKIIRPSDVNNASFMLTLSPNTTQNYTQCKEMIFSENE